MSAGFRGRLAGRDASGGVVRLGDRDSMGHVVGFIQSDGSCWESVLEHDTSTAAGRYADAVQEFRRGLTPDPPDVRAIAQAACIDPANVDAAVQEAEESLAFYDRLRDMSRPGVARFMLHCLQEDRTFDSWTEFLDALGEWLEEGRG